MNQNPTPNERDAEMSDADIELLAWKSVLENLGEKRRKRLLELLNEQNARPKTIQQRIIRWEKIIGMTGYEMPDTSRIGVLESCLEEAISVIKKMASDPKHIGQAKNVEAS